MINLFVLVLLAAFGSEPDSVPLGRAPGVDIGSAGNAWRYVFRDGRWWYWSASERWSYFDGSRWVDLDLMNRVLTDRRDLQIGVGRLGTLPSAEELRFQFGKLPVPRSRAGSFDLGTASPAAGRNIAGSFEGGAALPHSVMATPGEPVRPVNPYGPDSSYGAYGSTNPFRGGMHTGAGGNFGYGLGSERPAPLGGLPRTGIFKRSR